MRQVAGLLSLLLISGWRDVPGVNIDRRLLFWRRVLQVAGTCWLRQLCLLLGILGVRASLSLALFSPFPGGQAPLRGAIPVAPTLREGKHARGEVGL